MKDTLLEEEESLSCVHDSFADVEEKDEKKVVRRRRKDSEGCGEGTVMKRGQDEYE